MQRNRFAAVLARVSALLVLAVAVQAGAQSWPAQPVRIVVGYGPGTGIDIIARELANAITGPLRQTVVVENRPGVSGQIATDYVAQTKPDGYTIIITSTSGIINQIATSPKSDLLKDFEVLVHAGNIPYVIAVGATFAAESIKDVIELARKKPGQLNYASIGGGLPQYLGEMLTSQGKVDIVSIPYKSTTDATVDVISGRTQILFTTLASGIPASKGGKIRILGVTGEQRHPTLPNVPTMAEAGAPYLDLDASFFLLVPAGTPKAVVTRLNEELASAQTSKAVVDRFANQGITPSGGDLAFARRMLEREFNRWRSIIKPTPAKG